MKLSERESRLETVERNVDMAVSLGDKNLLKLAVGDLTKQRIAIINARKINRVRALLGKGEQL